MDYPMRAAGAKLFVLAAALGLGLIAAPQAQAQGNCKTVKLLPGVIQVYATARAGADAPASQFCTANYACPSGSRKVEVFGSALSSNPNAAIAVDNSAVLTTADAISANCLNSNVGTRKGVSVSTCNSKDASVAPRGTAAAADCAVFIDAPAGASVGANATCFCGV
ncbi:hypothetical protein [Pseudomonas sp. CGJS7]|uniref:hypothetical protein n=1 Tax=Pseudomonas sp. CGJS7 TaxID=3109348 RepID=UPI00300882EC